MIFANASWDKEPLTDSKLAHSEMLIVQDLNIQHEQFQLSHFSCKFIGLIVASLLAQKIYPEYYFKHLVGSTNSDFY